MPIIQCRVCNSILAPGSESCAGCGSEVLQRTFFRKARKPRSGTKSAERLWFVTLAMILCCGLLQVTRPELSSNSASALAGTGPDTPVVANLEIWPVLRAKYPDLRLQWKDFSGRRRIAVPDLFWNSLLASEKNLLVNELDTLFPGGDWILMTGRYWGAGQMGLEHTHERSEFFATRESGPAVAKEVLASSSSLQASAPSTDSGQPAQLEPAIESTAELGASPSGRPRNVPEYEILLRTDDELTGGRAYAEVLVSSLSPATPAKERKRIARGIAEVEGLDALTLYCTRDARQAHYSMEYADLHPQALDRGLLGTLERSRFRAHKPDDR